MEPPLPPRWTFARVLALTQKPAFPPSAYEQQLLASYQRGERTLDELVDLLETSTYQVLYHSRATPLPSLLQLRNILDHSRDYNATHQITGLLLGSEGHFVQLLEGTEEEVRTLFAKIQQDRRHQYVRLVSQGAARQRYFAPWRMGFAHVAATELTRFVAAVEARKPVTDLCFKDPYVQALWQAVSQGES
ncbi:BLUF domain-containing protein [uncultured Hymenobacter sp.]|uniref:BLUF domain-containing protein n=1 Tax=uncultured Hymenobacter sp. TaxID=170016 RepID=UPI0035CA8DFD